mmetsp:Transcript_30976/g.71392  ORF Transcript_30976/g.71392 Transcript_30976/m.71392 type:complete len:226 (-) Transcript_30976:376-1053(-)
MCCWIKGILCAARAVGRLSASFSRHAVKNWKNSGEIESSVGRGIGSWTRLWNSWYKPSLTCQGNRPKWLSSAITPMDQTSAGKEYTWPLTRSGDMYLAVPINVVCPRSRSSEFSSFWMAAIPKSPILATPSLRIRIFAGFRSRCTQRLCSCKKQMPTNACVIMRARTSCGMVWPDCLHATNMLSKEPRSMNSRAMNTLLREKKASCSVTMCGWALSKRACSSFIS